jgi:hypothetical protein
MQVELEGETLEDGVDYLTQSGMQPGTAWLYLARPLEPNDMLTITTDL